MISTHASRTLLLTLGLVLAACDSSGPGAEPTGPSAGHPAALVGTWGLAEHTSATVVTSSVDQPFVLYDAPATVTGSIGETLAFVYVDHVAPPWSVVRFYTYDLGGQRPDRSAVLEVERASPVVRYRLTIEGPHGAYESHSGEMPESAFARPGDAVAEIAFGITDDDDTGLAVRARAEHPRGVAPSGQADARCPGELFVPHRR